MAHRLSLCAANFFGGIGALDMPLRAKAISCEVMGVLASKGQGAFRNGQDDMCWCRCAPCRGG